MNTETSKSMNLLMQRNDDKINSVIPKAMRDLIKKTSESLNMSESAYIKLALHNQLEKDLNKSL